MRTSILFVALNAFLVNANNPGSVTYTYQTLVSGTVRTSTTSFPLIQPTPAPGHAETSYHLNRKDLAYPTFSNVVGPLATNAPAPGLPNATTIIQEAGYLIQLGQQASPANCAACQNIMAGLAARMKVQQETLSNVAIPFCTALGSVIPFPICIGLLKIGSTDIGGIFPAMNMLGEDGQILCAFMFGTCLLPAPPKLDLTALYKGRVTKPKPRVITPTKETPLKVLHISDYHLDLRYVVGSEAKCAEPLCCRVEPYANLSIPISQPASLFGNYLCDTPEPLATSLFRNVPKVTGHDWDDFAFGIFTGDLVSHDIWELTEDYVLAENLESYQQFFNGMGGVPMFPTLGNHDTFPHAFTSFPTQNKVLPHNASYPVQQAEFYRTAASAWHNYRWLTDRQAQEVVSSGLGIYRAVTKHGLVIISLNSDVWYYFNLYAYIGANTVDATGIFRILIDYLLEAESHNQAVWIIQHVNVGGSTDYEALPAATDLYYQIMDRFSNTIRGNFFGHTHEDEFGVFYTNNATVQTANTAVGVGYIMPSVTSYTNLNAGFRYYTVDPDTFDILDSLTYYANVSNSDAWAKAGEVTWEFEYSARATYDPSNKLLAPNMPLTPAFWHNVSEMIATNQTMFETYTDLRTKKYRPYKPVTGVQRNRTICGLRSMSVPIFETCLGSHASTTVFL